VFAKPRTLTVGNHDPIIAAMSNDSGTALDPLIPERYTQGELFLCDINQAMLKDDLATMENPFFSLSKKPDTKTRKYEHNGNFLEVIPSSMGMATIYDKDILIYAISKIVAAKNEGRPISKKVVINGKDLLIFINRTTGGKDYAALKSALQRLAGTTITTNIKTGGEEETEIFSLIESATVRRKSNNGRVVEWGVTLSDWLMNAINANEVLTLHRDYFRLRKPIERRVYELARKHCGRNESWKISLALLKKKSGAANTLRYFRMLIRDLEKNDHLPDYAVNLEENDMVVFTNRDWIEAVQKSTGKIQLSPDTYNDAKTSAPGWDIYYLEGEWRSWMHQGGMEKPRDPDKAFLGFCRSWYKRKGVPS